MTDLVWRPRPVFITSTFRDMHAERDYLRNFVFPVVDERLRERREYLEAIDLRQGVEISTEAEEQARELQVLKVCLDEVKRSRPFLIGLIGDRYGWVPPHERMRAAAEEAGFERDVAGRSVTELEIAFGVLAEPEQRQRALFYFREPLPYESMSSECAAEFSEEHSLISDAATSCDRLNALKTELRSLLPERCRSYRADWDAAARKVSGLEAWGEQVVQDLWRELDAETEQTQRAKPTTWQDAERWVLEQFIEERARSFIGRNALLDMLFMFATSVRADGGAWAFSLLGGAGTGKSAVFAELSRRLEKAIQRKDADVLLLAHAAGISPRAVRVDDLLARWVQELHAALGVSNPLDEGSSSSEIEEAFRRCLAEVAARKRVILLVDALDQLESTTRAQRLTWLPEVFPENVRLIATGIPGPATDALGNRAGVEQQTLHPMSRTDAGEITEAIYRRYHRALNPDVKQALLDKKTQADHSAYGNPLWLQIAVEALNLLDQDDFLRAEKDFAAEHDPAKQLRMLTLDTLARIPADMPGAYGWVLNRAEELHGTDFVRALVSLVAVSRSGWREKDFAAVVPGLTGEAWDELRFAAFRRTLRSHFVRRGAQGQWGFAHTQLELAVAARNLRDPEVVTGLHVALADHLNALPGDDSLRISEHMVHVLGTRDPWKIARHLTAELEPEQISGDMSAMVAAVKNSSTGEVGSLEWIDEFLQKYSDTAALHVLVAKFLELVVCLAREGMRESQLRLLVIVRKHVLAAQDQTNELTELEGMRNFFVCLLMLGDLYLEQGNSDEAYRVFEGTLAIAEGLASPDVDWSKSMVKRDVQRDLAVAQLKVIDAFLARDRIEDALRLARASVGILEGLLVAMPSNTTLCDHAAGQLKLAEVLRRAGQLDESLQTSALALETLERLESEGHEDTDLLRNLAAGKLEQGMCLEAFQRDEESVQCYQSNVSILEQLVNQSPTNIELRTLLASARLRYGNTLRKLSRDGEALDAYEANIRIAEHVPAIETTYQYQRTLSLTHVKTGELLKSMDRLDEATHSLQRGVDAYEALIGMSTEDPGDQHNLAAAKMWLGETLQTQGRFDEAEDAYTAAVEILENLVNRNSPKADWQSTLAIARRSAGTLRLQHQDYAGALPLCQSSVEAWEGLASIQPERAALQAELVRTQMLLGTALLGMERIDEAMHVTEQCVALQERLVEADSASFERQRQLFRVQRQIYMLCVAKNDPLGGLHAIRRAQEIAETCATLAPDEDQAQLDRAYCLEHAGEALFSLDRVAEAFEALEEASNVLMKIAASGPMGVDQANTLARLLCKVAQVSQEHNIGDSSHYWHTCYQILTTMKNAGVQIDESLANLLPQLEAAFDGVK